MFFSQTDREVRFHALQSMLLAAVALIVLIALAIVFGIIVGIVEASGSYTLQLQIESIRALVTGVAAWLSSCVQIFMCIQGYRQRRTRLPVIGELAERWSGAAART